jgi:hypothetical protein
LKLSKFELEQDYQQKLFSFISHRKNRKFVLVRNIDQSDQNEQKIKIIKKMYIKNYNQVEITLFSKYSLADLPRRELVR